MTAPSWYVGGEAAHYQPPEGYSPDDGPICSECDMPLGLTDHLEDCPLRPCDGCGHVGRPPGDTECDLCLDFLRGAAVQHRIDRMRGK
jgi:hypothetical protein